MFYQNYLVSPNDTLRKFNTLSVRISALLLALVHFEREQNISKFEV